MAPPTIGDNIRLDRDMNKALLWIAASVMGVLLIAPTAMAQPVSLAAASKAEQRKQKAASVARAAAKAKAALKAKKEARRALAEAQAASKRSRAAPGSDERTNLADAEKAASAAVDTAVLQRIALKRGLALRRKEKLNAYIARVDARNLARWVANQPIAANQGAGSVAGTSSASSARGTYDLVAPPQNGGGSSAGTTYARLPPPQNGPGSGAGTGTIYDRLPAPQAGTYSSQGSANLRAPRSAPIYDRVPPLQDPNGQGRIYDRVPSLPDQGAAMRIYDIVPTLEFGTASSQVLRARQAAVVAGAAQSNAQDRDASEN